MGAEARVSVKREAGGLVVTVEAPRLARFVQDYCKQQAGRSTPLAPETPDMRDLGQIWAPCQASGLGRGVQALSFITRWRGSDGPFIEGEGGGRDFGPDSVNLFMLRATKALEGPVTYTYKGLYSKESAQKYLDSAEKVITMAYTELTSKFDKTVVINVADVGPQQAVAASAPVAAVGSAE
jgi:hypothetical protein